MPSGMQYATIFIYALHIDTQLLFQHVYLIVYSQGRSRYHICTLFTSGIILGSINIVSTFLEKPRPAECSATNHHRVDAILLKCLLSTLRRCYVSIANDRYMYARIALYLTYK